MSVSTKLTPSQKIKELRKAANITQQGLGEALGCTKSKISRVEKGEWEYSEKDIATAKKFFGIEKAPFTDKELLDFKQRLYKWKDLIRNRLTDEARKNQKDLIVITKLPFEPDLHTLYRMFEIRLVLTEMNDVLAEEMLATEELLISEATEENKHNFYHNMGSLYIYKRDFKTALKYFLVALDYEKYVFEKDISLNLNLAICYSRLGKYALTIGILEEAYNFIDYNRVGSTRASVDSMLAINYVRLGQVKRAKRLLEKALSEVLGINNKMHLGIVYHNYGCACWKAKEYEEAIDYFDKACECFEKGDRFYIENMYWKIRSLIDLKEASKARLLLSEMKLISEGNEHNALIFESLSCLLAITDESSIEFIEKKTIPYLVDRYEYYRALDYCELLEGKFIKWGDGFKRRLSELTATIRSITKEVMFGEEVSFDEKEKEEDCKRSSDSGNHP